MCYISGEVISNLMQQSWESQTAKNESPPIRIPDIAQYNRSISRMSPLNQDAKLTQSVPAVSG